MSSLGAPEGVPHQFSAGWYFQKKPLVMKMDGIPLIKNIQKYSTKSEILFSKNKLLKHVQFCFHIYTIYSSHIN